MEEDKRVANLTLIISYLLFCQKCDISEPLNFGNGKPTIPVLNDRTLPKFLEYPRVGKTVSRKDIRLKLFSGTANPSLSQVTIDSHIQNNYIYIALLLIVTSGGKYQDPACIISSC